MSRLRDLWIRLDLNYRFLRLRERLLLGIIWRLPRSWIYWAVVRGLAHATQGRWGAEHPEQVTAFQVLKRWGGDGR